MSRKSSSRLCGTLLTDIKKYQRWYIERQSDIQNVSETRNQLCRQLDEWKALKIFIEKMEPPGVAALCDLGYNFYMKTKLIDNSKITVDIGLGYLVELSREEALVVIEKKVKIIKTKCDFLNEKEAWLNAQKEFFWRQLH